MCTCVVVGPRDRIGHNLKNKAVHVEDVDRISDGVVVAVGFPAVGKLVGNLVPLRCMAVTIHEAVAFVVGVLKVELDLE